MIFAFHGYAVSQERIVENVFGKTQNRGASAQQITDAVDGYWMDDTNIKVFLAECDILFDEIGQISQTEPVQRAAEMLADGIPSIIGASNHATILTKLIS